MALRYQQLTGSKQTTFLNNDILEEDGRFAMVESKLWIHSLWSQVTGIISSNDILELLQYHKSFGRWLKPFFFISDSNRNSSNDDNNDDDDTSNSIKITVVVVSGIIIITRVIIVRLKMVVSPEEVGNPGSNVCVCVFVFFFCLLFFFKAIKSSSMYRTEPDASTSNLFKKTREGRQKGREREKEREKVGGFKDRQWEWQKR